MPGCGNQKTITPLSLDGRDNANEWKESLLFVSRVQLILFKDNARRVQRQSVKTLFSQL